MLIIIVRLCSNFNKYFRPRLAVFFLLKRRITLCLHGCRKWTLPLHGQYTFWAFSPVGRNCLKRFSTPCIQTSKNLHEAGSLMSVHPEGLEPPTTDPKSVMISISLWVHRFCDAHHTVIIAKKQRISGTIRDIHDHSVTNSA